MPPASEDIFYFLKYQPCLLCIVYFLLFIGNSGGSVKCGANDFVCAGLTYDEAVNLGFTYTYLCKSFSFVHKMSGTAKYLFMDSNIKLYVHIFFTHSKTLNSFDQNVWWHTATILKTVTPHKTGCQTKVSRINKCYWPALQYSVLKKQKYTTSFTRFISVLFELCVLLGEKVNFFKCWVLTVSLTADK